MQVDTLKFLHCDKTRVIFEVKPRKIEKKGASEATIDWLEAFKAIGCHNEKLDHEINWLDKYKKIVSFRDNCLQTCSKIPLKDLEKTVRYVSPLLEISDELREISTIFSKTHPMTHENLSHAIYLQSEEKLLELYKNVAFQLNLNPKPLLGRMTRKIDSSPVQKKFKERNLVEKTLPDHIFKHYCKENGLENASWQPEDEVVVLMEELVEHGPLLASGNFGKDFYTRPPKELSHKIGKREMPVWGWEQEDKLFIPSLTNAKLIGEEFNRIVLIGAQKSKNSNGHVFFIDPSSDEEKVYMISLDGLRKRIRDLWSGALLQYTDVSYVARHNSQFALYDKNFILTKKEQWQKDYELLIKEQEKGLHPLSAPPSMLRGIKTKFMEIFDKASEEGKKKLARAPLFPPTKKFIDSKMGLSIDSAKPLNYIIFCGDYQALEKIAPYLEEGDYCEKGPYDSTLIHCLISGYQKNVIDTSQNNSDPLQCAKFLLNKRPELRNIPNSLGTRPLAFAQEILKLGRGTQSLKEIIELLKDPK